VCVCCCAVWRRTRRRKESYNARVPTSLPHLAKKRSLVVNRVGKRTVRPERVVCGGREVVTGLAGSLRGWTGGLPVSCRVPSST